jgi:hypothetical protein
MTPISSQLSWEEVSEFTVKERTMRTACFKKWWKGSHKRPSTGKKRPVICAAAVASARARAGERELHVVWSRAESAEPRGGVPT